MLHSGWIKRSDGRLLGRDRVAKPSIDLGGHNFLFLVHTTGSMIPRYVEDRNGNNLRASRTNGL